MAIVLLWLTGRLGRVIQDWLSRLPTTDGPQPEPYDEAYDAVVREIAARNGRRDALRDLAST